MAIALFGTSADPPTEGHRTLLEGLRHSYPRVVTWASDNPSKRHGAPLELRARLLGTLVAAIGDPGLSLEQDLSSPWAVETLERARRRWPDQPLVFVVGSDLLDQIPRWRRAEQVLRLCSLAVAPRRGWPVQEDDLNRLRGLGAQLELLELEVPATASSRIRAAAARSLREPAAAAGEARRDTGNEGDRAKDSAGLAPDGAEALREVPRALWPLLLQHNLYGLHSPTPPDSR